MTEPIHQVKTQIYRMKKNDSAFFYFTLEANEGICFYSTLDSSKGESYRDIEVSVPTGLWEQFEKILEHLRQEFEITLLSD